MATWRFTDLMGPYVLSGGIRHVCSGDVGRVADSEWHGLLDGNRLRGLFAIQRRRSAAKVQMRKAHSMMRVQICRPRSSES